MNVRLLRKVAKHITKEPRRIYMEGWIADPDKVAELGTPCGTAACIAGWAYLLSDGDKRQYYEVRSRAKSLLAIDDVQADRLFTSPGLFHFNRWPDEFSNRYLKAKTPRGRANATVARIEHFIKTKGQE